MLHRVFPTSLDNKFPGHKIALYVFYALTALTLWRSQHHLFGHDGGAQSIASIPLDTYPSNPDNSTPLRVRIELDKLAFFEANTIDSLLPLTAFDLAKGFDGKCQFCFETHNPTEPF